jgi:Uma2 family endonuclease
MRTVLVGPPAVEVEAWLERRRQLGLDRFDEVWEGEHHAVPGPHGRHGRVDDQLARILGPRADAASLYGSGPLNIGRPDDSRVPDRAYLRTPDVDLYQPTAAIVVEIISPGDETRHKLDFYHRAGVDELLIIDPEAHTVEWFARAADRFVPTDHSQLLGLSAADLASAIIWPD